MTHAAPSKIVGSRVEAWAGHRFGQFGTVTRVHGRDWWLVRWDEDGEEERYWVADLLRVPGGEK